MTVLRPYQRRAIDELRQTWRQHRRVCLVLPTGGGKTVLLEEVLALRAQRGHPSALVVVHRTELLSQTTERLARRLGPYAVGCIAPGSAPAPSAPVQVATVQTLLARPRESWPAAVSLVQDECHHYQADDWAAVGEHYASALTLGLTATPERGDGRPLAGSFDALIVGAHYSELLECGALVPCIVLRPPEHLGSGLALSPVDAYQRHGEGRSGFVFAGSIEAANSLAVELCAAGVPSAAVTSETPAGERAARLAGLRDGSLRLLTSVQALTEGVDVPAASVCVLARAPGHVSTYLQMVGRVLRSHPGKRDALLIDLAGSSLTHGLPTEDREYSLSGEGISRRADAPPLRVCQQCGVTWAPPPEPCPSCGYAPPHRERRRPVIHDVELQRVYDWERTPEPAQRRERHRLYAVAVERGLAAGWVVRQLVELFGESGGAPLPDAPQELRSSELQRLSAVCLERGHQPGWASHRYRALFGSWPRKVRE